MKEQKKNLQNFISYEIISMKQNILEKFEENMKNRMNNFFCTFNNKKIIMYMMLGRSIDSQLGTKLQHIAMYMARERYGFSMVPNLVVMYQDKKNICIRTVADPWEKGCQQKIKRAESKEKADALIEKNRKRYIMHNPSSVNSFKIELESDEKVREILDCIKPSKGKSHDRVLDLLYFVDEDGKLIEADCFELKSGGNLDTKNSDANIREVDECERLFNFLPKSYSFFATCYNNRGEGNEPDGNIFAEIPKDKQLIGREFWERVIPNYVTYDEFKTMYIDTFKKSKIEYEINKKVKEALEKN